jgi:hypothetical protein
MPISLICGACDAPLTAPDAAAGKRVKCRKCAAILEVPLPEPDEHADFEVIEDAPTMMMPPIKKSPPAAPRLPPPAAAKPKPKPVLMEIDEDDDDDRPAPKKKPKPVMLDDDEDDRPSARKKPTKKLAVVEDEYDDEEDDSDDEPRPKKGKKGKAKKKAAGSNLPLLIGGGVLGVAVAVFLVWYLVIREHQYTLNTPTPPQDSGVTGAPPLIPPGKGGGMPGPGGGGGGVPAGWQEFTKPEFTASIRATGQPQVQSLPTAPGIQTGNAYAFRTQNPNGAQVVTVVTLDQLGATAAQQDPNKMMESMFAGGAGKSGGVLSARSDSLLDGKPARDATLTNGGKQMFIRGAIVGNRVYMLLAGGDGVSSVQDEQVKTFFDSFKITGQ